MGNRKGYKPLTEKEYLDAFSSKEGKKKHRRVFEKAWETRNYEIDKFWVRTAFFWGFIALISTGYMVVMTSKNNQALLDMNFDIYLNLALFSRLTGSWLFLVAKIGKKTGKPTLTCWNMKLRDPCIKLFIVVSTDLIRFQ